MRRERIHLADGRELVYYDHDGAPERVGSDERDLAGRPPGSELRYDPFLGVWVMVAASRQDRTYLPLADDCPLCPSRDGRHTEVPAADYGVAVLENRFPALSGEQASVVELPLEPSHMRRDGSGRCEVVCYSPRHDASFVDLSPADVELVLEAWTDRTAALSTIPAVEQVFCFENRGADVGVTLQHPHGQIYAYPFVTPRTRRALDSAREHEVRTGRNLYDDVLAAERRDGSRVVAENRSWTAFVPFAARWPYEVHLYPRRRVPDLTALADEEREDFPSIYLDLLRRFDGLFDGLAGGRTPYMSGWHQAPVRSGRELLALHLEMFTVRRSADKLKYLASSESGMDAFANDVVPEVAAARLRELAQ
jgi:UDPglucose--hexose-1-phosphate uridylyltransferase